jgi:hypothetical protein
MVAASERRQAGEAGPNADRWSGAAARFRADPRRELDENLETLLSYIRPDDVVLDVGGGAGRFGLPIALHCREVVNVEPAPGMGKEFEAAAHEAGITNARWVESGWPGDLAIEGDVCLSVNVTHFVSDIVPFIEKLIACARRRVMIAVSSEPSPNQGADLYRLINGREMAMAPDFRRLVAVIWEMGIMPDILVRGPLESTRAGDIFASRDAAIESTLPRRADEPERLRLTQTITDHFDELFLPAPGGFRRRPTISQRMVLITWETAKPA